MESLAVYIVKSIVCSGILFFFYMLALRDRKFHCYNRFYLLGVLLISLVVPLINFRFYSFSYNAGEVTNSVNNAILARDVVLPGFSVQEVVLLSCGAISVFMMICLFLKILWIYRMIRKHEVRRMDGYYFIESGLKEAPFTFLDKLFWKKTISLKEDVGQKIFSHELVHIRQKHTYDKLFSQFVLCFFWMNPFYWLVQRELNLVHEFLADAKSIKGGDVAAFAEMLLRSHNDGSYLDPVHPFFNSSVKRRLEMITRSVEPVNNYTRRMTALPLVVIIIAMFSISLTEEEISGKKFNRETISIKLSDPIVTDSRIPESGIAIKNDTALNIANSTKGALKIGKAASLKKSYKKETGQKDASHFAGDKLAGIEKLAELQKPVTKNKDKFHTAKASEKNLKDEVENSGIRKKMHTGSSSIKESLKPASNGVKPPYFSAKQNSEMVHKFQSATEVMKKPGMGESPKFTTNKPIAGSEKTLKPGIPE